MRKIAQFIVPLIMAGVLGAGCRSEGKQQDHTTAAGHPEELQDSTRLDAASAGQSPKTEPTLSGSDSARPTK